MVYGGYGGREERVFDLLCSAHDEVVYIVGGGREGDVLAQRVGWKDDDMLMLPWDNVWVF